MLDLLYVILIMAAFVTLVLSIKLKNVKIDKEGNSEGDPFWNIIFIAVAIGLFFILALYTTGGVQTPYSAYNSTLGNTSMYYSTYAPEEFVYLAYFWGLMACLCIIYLVVTIFGYYYERLDEQLRDKERDMQD